MAKVVPVASFCRFEKKIYSKETGLWKQQVVWFYLLMWEMNIRGNGSICILECKVLFILQEIVPVSKGTWLPVGFFSFIILQDSILHVFTFV